MRKNLSSGGGTYGAKAYMFRYYNNNNVSIE